MRIYVISNSEEGKYKEFTLHASEPGALGSFVAELLDKDCDIHDIKLTKPVIPLIPRTE